MIEDYKLLTNMDIFYKKKFFIWGVGKYGKELAQSMSIYTKQIVFVDTDKKKAGEYCGIPICQPDVINEYKDSEGVAVVLSPDSIQTQKCILEQIRQMGLCEIDIYTRHAVEAVVAFINHKNMLSEKCDEQEIYFLEKRINELFSKQKMQEQLLMTIFAEKSVFVYQSKKVGSTSITGSIRNFGIYGFHVHNFAWLNIDSCFVRDIIKKDREK